MGMNCSQDQTPYLTSPKHKNINGLIKRVFSAPPTTRQRGGGGSRGPDYMGQGGLALIPGDLGVGTPVHH